MQLLQDKQLHTTDILGSKHQRSFKWLAAGTHPILTKAHRVTEASAGHQKPQAAKDHTTVCARIALHMHVHAGKERNLLT